MPDILGSFEINGLNLVTRNDRSRCVWFGYPFLIRAIGCDRIGRCGAGPMNVSQGDQANGEDEPQYREACWRTRPGCCVRCLILGIAPCNALVRFGSAGKPTVALRNGGLVVIAVGSGCGIGFGS